jgi:hypothetical protein
MADDNPQKRLLEDDAAEMQKAMLLMRPSDWIQASTECYPLSCRAPHPNLRD